MTRRPIGDDAVIGRDQEMAAIEAFLDGSGKPRLAIEGGSGVGKSTLWHAALAAARDHGYRVLATSPVAVERHLAFSGLNDLVAGLLMEYADRLPAPRRRALEAALLVRDVDGRPPDERAIAFAVNDLVGLASTELPLLLAVDDVQWLDPSSAAVLGYALRRADGRGVRALVARRIEDGQSGDPLGLWSAAGLERWERLSLSGLSLGAVQQIIAERLGIQLPRSLLIRVHDVSAGNPLYALELARAVGHDRGKTLRRGRLPVPERLAELLELRLGGSAPSATWMLALAAVLSRPTRESLRASFAGELAASDVDALIETAVADGLLEEMDDRLRFTHPLLAAAAEARLSAAERPRIYRMAAGAAATEEERLRDLALASLAPDAALARRLDEAARQASNRGAASAAVELTELAIDLTPAAEDRTRRQLDLADLLLYQGELERASMVVQMLVDSLPPSPARAAALRRAALFEEDVEDAIDHLRQALSEAGQDPGLLTDIHLLLGVTLGVGGDLSAWQRELEAGASWADVAGDRRRRAIALGRLGLVRAMQGQGAQRQIAADAQALLGPGAALPAYDQPSMWLGVQLTYADMFDESRALMEGCLRQALDDADLYSEQSIRVHLIRLELRAGNLGRANEHADALENEADDTWRGHKNRAPELVAIAAAHGSVGRPGARQELQVACDHAASTHLPLWQTAGECALAQLELSIGNAAAAWERLAILPERLRRWGIREPGVEPVLPLAIEAAVGVGALREAEPWLDELEREARALDRSSALAAWWMCRGLLTDGRGETGATLEALQEAVRRYDLLPRPVEQARARLALGTALRRAKRRREARAALRAAHRQFVALGAGLWAERAAAELARLPGRPRSERLLTPTEQQISELVARGLSNKEVAAAMHLTVHTVETTLSHVYGKLGVRSRTELALRLTVH